MCDPSITKHCQRRLRQLHVIRAAKQLQIPLTAPVVKRIATTKFLQTRTTVISNPLHALLVYAKPLEVALAQPACNPTPLCRIERRPEDQRRRRFEQVFEHLRRHSRRGPRRHIAGRNHAGIAETGGERHIGLALDHRDFAPMTCQIKSGSDANHASAENNRFHVCGMHIRMRHPDPRRQRRAPYPWSQADTEPQQSRADSPSRQQGPSH